MQFILQHPPFFYCNNFNEMVDFGSDYPITIIAESAYAGGITMQIKGISGSTSPQSAPSSNMQDPISDNIRKQIQDLQDRLKSVSQNQEMPPKEKLNKQKELRDQIANLKSQLTERQHQLRQEKLEKSREKQGQGEPESTARTSETGTVDGRTVSVLLSTDQQMNTVERMDSVKISMEGRAKALASEISLDQQRGLGVLSSKHEELADLERKIGKLGDAISGELGDINHEVENTENTEGNPSEREQDNHTSYIQHKL